MKITKTINFYPEKTIFDEWLNGGYASWNHKQLISLIAVVLICLIFSLVVYIKLKKESKVDKAPAGLLFVMEGYVKYIDKAFDETSDNKIPKARFYIFGLAGFLLVGNLIGLIGLEPITTSFSVAITLGFISWSGIYITGFIYQKHRYFNKYKNPIESIGQFIPLISISFRIFGNIIGGNVLMFLVYFFFAKVWAKMTGQPDFDEALANNKAWPLLAPIVTPFLHMYFDLFSVFIQATVFCLLTTVWWSSEADVEVVEKKDKKNKNNEAEIVSKMTTKETIY